jgi:prevent-host-death family protein
MAMVNIHEAKTNLSRLIEQALAGEEIIIAKAGTPVVTLSPIKAQKSAKRKLGAALGQVWMAPDFDELPQDVLDAFYNGPIFPVDYTGPMAPHKVSEGVPVELPDAHTANPKNRKPTRYTTKRRSKKS